MFVSTRLSQKNVYVVGTCLGMLQHRHAEMENVKCSSYRREKNKLKNRIWKKTAWCGLPTTFTIFHTQAGKNKIK